ncbi:hypothetical protein MSS4_05471 [Mycobacterium marinum]|nr:hypothetical protein VIMS_04262 [Mycobacterium marinum]RFZ40338.1 hypothetical protein MSS4_05471 [Mycobacterium marinum]
MTSIPAGPAGSAVEADRTRGASAAHTAMAAGGGSRVIVTGGRGVSAFTTVTAGPAVGAAGCPGATSAAQGRTGTPRVAQEILDTCPATSAAIPARSTGTGQATAAAVAAVSRKHVGGGAVGVGHRSAAVSAATATHSRATGLAVGPNPAAYCKDVADRGIWAGRASIARLGAGGGGVASIGPDQPGAALPTVAAAAEQQSAAAVAAAARAAAVDPGQCHPAGSAGTAVAVQQPPVAAGAAGRAGTACATGSAATPQAGRASGPTSLAGGAGCAATAVAVQQPSGAPGLARRRPIGAVADERATQQRLGRRVDHAEYLLL